MNTESLNTMERDSLRKRWLYIMPAVIVTYSLAYLDRSNYGFGVAAGMAQTLHISGKQVSLLGAAFFLGYFAFQLPGAALAKRWGVTRVVFALLIAWGGFAALTGVIQSYPWLLLDRLLLGIAESLIFPAMLMLLTHWFTRAERSRSNALLILGNPLTVLWRARGAVNQYADGCMMTDWTQEDTEVPGDNTHLWEESWDDDDTSEDFSAQLK